PIFFSRYTPLRSLPSFPTRRSSDLGEIYLRGLQRLSAVAFGTRPGRFLTRYLALPFGGAFVVLEGLQHVVNPISRALTGNRVYLDRKSTRLNSSHRTISYAVFCLKK